MKPIRFFHTVRYLKPEQVIYRLYRKIRPFHALPVCSDSYTLTPRSPQTLAFRGYENFKEDTFTFLNHSETFSENFDWEAPGTSHLWRYNLHYFQYLRETSPLRGTALILHWIKHNSRPGGVGWQPYALSMRIREWLEWLHQNNDIQSEDKKIIIRSLAKQTTALSQQLEFHLLGNHILENAVTLCWAALSIEGPDTSAWLRDGTTILKRELSRQILADGTHDERSPMYQALIAEGLLRLSAICSDVGSAAAIELRRIIYPVAERLIDTLGYMVHPDGNYALVNDCALDNAPLYSELCRRFEMTHRRTDRKTDAWKLESAGYVGYRDEKGTYLIFDVGPIGPNHQPGHGHADTLSFELSLFGKRVVSDTGIDAYDRTPHRIYTRSTAAHNTIEIDGQNSSDVWASFRCGQRAKTFSPQVSIAGRDITFNGRIQYSSKTTFSTIKHERQITLSNRTLLIHDIVQAKGSHTICSRIHFSPQIYRGDTEDIYQLTDSDRTIRIETTPNHFTTTQTLYHPQFGVSIPRICRKQEFVFSDTSESTCQLSW